MRDDLKQRYDAAMHRMQSATAFDVARSLNVAEHPLVVRMFKHQRVGLNSAMASAGGLVELLIDKGVLTMEEYQEAMVVSSEREADARVEEVRMKYDLPEPVRFS